MNDAIMSVLVHVLRLAWKNFSETYTQEGTAWIRGICLFNLSKCCQIAVQNGASVDAPSTGVPAPHPHTHATQPSIDNSTKSLIFTSSFQMIYNLSSHVCLASLSFHPVHTPLFCWRPDTLVEVQAFLGINLQPVRGHMCLHHLSVCCCGLCLCDPLLSSNPYVNPLLPLCTFMHFIYFWCF